MAYTKIKNLRLFIDTVNTLELLMKHDPENKGMIEYLNSQINLLTKRVYR